MVHVNQSERAENGFRLDQVLQKRNTEDGDLIEN